MYVVVDQFLPSPSSSTKDSLLATLMMDIILSSKFLLGLEFSFPVIYVIPLVLFLFVATWRATFFLLSLAFLLQSVTTSKTEVFVFSCGWFVL